MPDVLAAGGAMNLYGGLSHADTLLGRLMIKPDTVAAELISDVRSVVIYPER